MAREPPGWMLVAPTGLLLGGEILGGTGAAGVGLCFRLRATLGVTRGDVSAGVLDRMASRN